MNEVLPVLFSPTSSVSGAKRAVCLSRKQRKFLIVIWSMRFPFLCWRLYVGISRIRNRYGGQCVFGDNCVGVGRTGADVVWFQFGVILQNGLCRHALCQQAQDEFY